MVSEVSLGGSPVPPEGVFMRALEMGVNYVDTSPVYQHGNSERTIGKIIKNRRDTFHVATKIIFIKGRNTQEALVKQVEESLERLQTDYVDVLLVHGAATPAMLADEAILGAFECLKKDGKIRFAGASCHKDPMGVLSPAIRGGAYDVITVAYNAHSGSLIEKGKRYKDYLARSGIEALIGLAKEHDVGVVAMKSMAGGERQDLAGFKSEGASLAQAKLKWVLQNRGIATVISEMVNYEILQENLSVSGADMTQAEKSALEKYVRTTWGDYCRMCGTCLGECGAGIAIPDIMRSAMYYDGYGKRDLARSVYRGLPVAMTYPACNQCKKCESACPYGLMITEKLRRTHHMLG
jgi:predicted aldo/keto reductase-like oxidoreductase